MSLDKTHIALIVGKKVRELRERAGVSQQDLSSHLQISRPTLVAYETGKQAINVAEAYLAADFFHVEISELVPSLNQIKNQTSLASALVQKGIVGEALRDVEAFISEKIRKEEK